MISSETNHVTANGTGSATSFSFSPLVINQSSHLHVQKIAADGTVTDLVEGSGAANYTVVVSSYPGTGSVTYPSTGATRLAVGEKLYFCYDVPFTQTTHLGNEAGYQSAVQEATFDYCRMVDLQQQEQLDRTIKAAAGYSGSLNVNDILATILGYVAACAQSLAACLVAQTTCQAVAVTATNAANAALTSQTAANGSAVAAAASAATAAASANAFYDTPFNAGYTSTLGGLDLVVQTYGDVVVSRALTLTGESGYIRTPATGSVAIFDIQKNGTSVYTTKPQFAVSANAITAGVLKSDGTQIFAAGDRMTFLCTQVGSTVKGQQVMFTSKGHV